MIRSILTVALVLLTPSWNVTYTQKREVRNTCFAGCYSVEIKDVLFDFNTTSDILFAPVEVGGVRLIEEKSTGVLTGEIAGIPNKEGPVRLNFEDWGRQPLTVQLSWDPLTLPDKGNERLKMNVYFHPNGIDPQRPVSQLPHDSWEFTVVRRPIKPPPIPVIPKITSFTVSPSNGYINCGDSATLSWATANCDSGGQVTLTGKDGLNYYDLLINLPGRPPSGSMSVSPKRSTFTKYILTASSPAGSDSKEVVVQIYCPMMPPPPAGSGVFCFKLTNNQSLVSKCYIVAVYDRDESAAKKSVEDTYPGYTAEKTLCNSQCP